MAAQNKKAFRLTNIVFAVLHGFLLLVCIGALLKNDIVPYYYFETLHGRNIPDYPIYTAILTHALALMFHVSFAVAHEQVIDTGFSATGTNGYHWGLQAVGLRGLLGQRYLGGHPRHHRSRSAHVLSGDGVAILRGPAPQPTL
mmetsp:Transcript_21120/g.67335  ORF Transcript_21120/g.67335 Transcript_21120/m.67335 type:complete len:143 (-) Transcript_21120:793-1221(-)